MGYPSYSPTFEKFSETNKLRCETAFKTAVHEWNLSDWAVAMAGEAGEACNVVKKLNRCRDGIGDFNRGVSEDDLRQQLAKEIGDVYAYLDLMAQHLGLSIYTDCIAPAFNGVSERMECDIRVRTS